MRITVEMVREAYAARGTKPCRGRWHREGCECPALAVAKHLFGGDTPPLIRSQMYSFVQRELQISKGYLIGFIVAIDYGIAADDASAEHVQGFEDGLLVAREFFPEMFAE